MAINDLMMKSPEKVANHISDWLSKYIDETGMNGFVVGISGGIDSAVTSTLCAKTGKKVLCLEMPIMQESSQVNRAQEHIKWLISNYENVTSLRLPLDSVFTSFTEIIPVAENKEAQFLSLANTRARLRMTTLYQVAAANKGIVVGTGNKVEDFGVGFYTKYGDGGVDISPIADCNKTEVWELGKELDILKEIIDAPPTDGLWDDGRTDEGQLGFKYEKLEDAMKNQDSPHRKEYEKIRKQNLHKMEPIPVCKIPS